MTAVNKGRKVDESEIPPPVASGASVAPARPAVPPRPAPPAVTPPEPTTPEQQGESEVETVPEAPEIVEPGREEEQSSSASLPILSSLPSPEEEGEEAKGQPDTNHSDGQF